LSEGTYDYEIIETDDKPSKKTGNEMFTFTLNVFNEEGNPRQIKDYISFGNNFGERKFRHAADASGIINIYESGNLKHTDFLGRTGKVDMSIQEGNKDYPNPKNVVKDYVKREPGKVEDAKPKVEDSDRVPF